MKTRFQFIRFEEISRDAGRSHWLCINNRDGTRLGTVAWYPAWRQYCYSPGCPADYSAGCLADIQEFIKSISEMPR
jgi:hypothetical protein